VGSIVSYQWSFGDGQSATTSTPSAAHVYAAPGAYPVSLTVTDSAGTSLTQVFTGQTMSLHGGPEATITHLVTVLAPVSVPPRPTPSVTHLAQSHATWAKGRALPRFASVARRKPPVGTTFSFTLNENAQVSLVLTRQAGGRKVGGQCRAATRGNVHRPRCNRTITAATLSFQGRAGLNRLAFQGRISRSRTLPVGRYTLTVTASAFGLRSRGERISFTIV
jgi:hypothetical protein